MAHHLSCSVAYGILFLQPRIEPASPAPQGEFFIFGSLGLAAWAFMQFGWPATLVMVPWLLTAVASLVAEHRPCSTWASVVTGPEL